MTEQEQIAEFIAKRGVTKCAPGVADGGRKPRDPQPILRKPALYANSEWLWEMGFQKEASNRARGK